MNDQNSWTWQTEDGPSTLEQGEVVLLDDGCSGIVLEVNLRMRPPRILVSNRRLGTDDQPDRWYIPANIVG